MVVGEITTVQGIRLMMLTEMTKIEMRMKGMFPWSRLVTMVLLISPPVAHSLGFEKRD